MYSVRFKLHCIYASLYFTLHIAVILVYVNHFFFRKDLTFKRWRCKE